LLAGVALIGLMAQPALAQSQDTTEQQQQQPAQAEQQQLAQEDIEFATKAAEGGLKEVRFGELAQQQAARDEVKQFGQRMVEDHGKASDQLEQIAQDKGIELPQELSDEDQQKYDGSRVRSSTRPTWTRWYATIRRTSTEFRAAGGHRIPAADQHR
jgi:putative membrane protein